MNILIFCHSILSDWNHGNAHFLRGLATELDARGHGVTFFEREDAWSVTNLLADKGPAALQETLNFYPRLNVIRYQRGGPDVDRLTENADLVLAHEWNDRDLIRRLGEARARNSAMRLLFHDTHHRALTSPGAMASYDLGAYDGAIVFGEAIRQIYLDRGWARAAWTLHEAADTNIFKPYGGLVPCRDLVWIGNWGDDERAAELNEYLFEPARELELSGAIFGVRYPEDGLADIESAGLGYGGYLPNYLAPAEFAVSRVTMHVPRRPYAQALPGIPTIRPFEAMACGIPLISAPWDDVERLFTPGADYLIAHDGKEMKRLLRDIIHDGELARGLSVHGRQTILNRHTCSHRAEELLAICRELGLDTTTTPTPARTSGATQTPTESLL